MFKQLALLAVLSSPFTARAFAEEPKDDALPALVSVLKESDDPQFQLDILKGMSDALRGRPSVKMPTGWSAAAEKLMKSPNKEVRSLTESLSTLFGDEKTIGAARKLMMDKNADPQARQKALESLLETKPANFAPVLHSLLKDPVLRGAALRGLAAYDDPATPDLVLSLYNTFTPSEKKDALTTLASREVYAVPMVRAMWQNQIPVKDLTPAAARQLVALDNENITKYIQSAYGQIRTSPDDKLKDMAALKNTILAAKPGEADPSRGRAVFNKTCYQCHTLFGEGGKVGPDLTGSGRADIDYLMQNVVDPSSVVGKDYLVWNIRLKKGNRLITGIISKEDERALTVLSENETLILQRNDIERMKQTDVSMMPEGLLQGLPRQDLLDLISYLRSPQQVALPPGTPPPPVKQ